jgi:hypothetical protein
MSRPRRRLTQAVWFLWGFDEERRKRDEPVTAHIDLNGRSKRDRRTVIPPATE